MSDLSDQLYEDLNPAKNAEIIRKAKLEAEIKKIENETLKTN